MLHAIGRYDEAISVAEPGRDVLHKAGLSATLGCQLLATLSESLFALGRWDEAEARVEEAREHQPTGVFAAYGQLIAGQLAAARGDLARAHECLRQAPNVIESRLGVAQLVLPYALLSAELALAERRFDDVIAVTISGLQVPGGHGDASYSWALLTTGARALGLVHNRARTFGESFDDQELRAALTLAAESLPTSAPPWHAHATQFVAELDSLDRPSLQWRDVVEAWDSAGEPYRMAYARLRLAEAELDRRNKKAGRQVLWAADELATRLGAGRLRDEIAHLAHRARLDLAARPAPPPPVTELRRLGLTNREAEVLKLLTRGFSNRQIATELFITVKTVSVHVSRILMKLHAPSRSAAAATAHRLRLFPEED
ncbi:helix-turn-helix transcriptional regulator [Thermoactinospora rubra]|uniref:helix-turn-helix transcriptional regulator n=1 Tax=Thermoactinospora rubra TaxID=1088767 RepID=UPI001301C03C|nr:response regulator transcription factor [Thermoactinospora rubra]